MGEVLSRVHTDMGTGVKGAFEMLCRRLSARHTGTGGYASASNPLAEGWNRLAQESLRSTLAACTGGEGYFQDLWLLGLVHAVYWLNRTAPAGKVSPYEQV